MDLAASFGVVLDPWQEDVVKAALGERPDGRWAARQVGLSAPRQNGKSEIFVARALAGILLFGEQLIVCSAHQQDTAREVFQRIVDVCESHPLLDSRVDQYGKALNREYIRFKSGQVIRFKARSKPGGRGFSADCLLLDEAQILGASAWSSIFPTTSARANAQAWLFGTPPTPDDDSEVFTRLRRAAMDARPDAPLVWFEWAADRGMDLDDPDTWAAANPAFPFRISADAIAGERATMTDGQFMTERLGIWPATGTTVPPVIDPEAWAALVAPAPSSGATAYGVRFSPDGARVALAVAVRPEVGPPFVEVVDALSGGTAAGMGSLADWLAERWRGAVSIVIDGRSGAGALVEALTARGVRPRVLHRPTLDDVVTAHGGLLEAVRTGELSHAGQPGLVASVAGAARRDIGQLGGWGFTGIGDADVTPVEAVVFALFGLSRGRSKSKARARAGTSRNPGGAVFA